MPFKVPLFLNHTDQTKPYYTVSLNLVHLQNQSRVWYLIFLRQNNIWCLLKMCSYFVTKQWRFLDFSTVLISGRD